MNKKIKLFYTSNENWLRPPFYIISLIIKNPKVQ